MKPLPYILDHDQLELQPYSKLGTKIPYPTLLYHYLSPTYLN